MVNETRRRVLLTVVEVIGVVLAVASSATIVGLVHGPMFGALFASFGVGAAVVGYCEAHG